VLLSRHQNAGQNRDTEIANRPSENVAQFKYLGTTAKREKSKFYSGGNLRGDNSGNACYHSIQNLSSPRLLFKRKN
jgi:hypothetical protein